MAIKQQNRRDRQYGPYIRMRWQKYADNEEPTTQIEHVSFFLRRINGHRVIGLKLSGKLVTNTGIWCFDGSMTENV